MASVRKPHVAAVLGALGVAAAVTAVYYTIRVNEKNRAKMAEDEPTADTEFGVANTGEPFFNNDQASSPTTLHQVRKCCDNRSPALPVESKLISRDEHIVPVLDGGRFTFSRRARTEHGAASSLLIKLCWNLSVYQCVR